MSNQMQAPQQPPPPAYAQEPAAAPANPGPAPTFMFVLAVIGILSMVIDYAAGSVVVDKLAGKVTDLSGNPVTVSWFNPGTMYATLGFGLIIGVLGILVRKGSNGARITGAIFAIIFALMGLGSILLTLLMAGAADVSAENAGVGLVVPNWYYLGGVVLGLTQTVISILAIVMLFGKKAAAFCKVSQA